MIKVNLNDIVNSVDIVPKSMIPDSSLMWEFVDKD